MRKYVLAILVLASIACTVSAGGVISSPPRVTEPDTALARLSDLATATAAPDVTITAGGKKPREWTP